MEELEGRAARNLQQHHVELGCMHRTQPGLPPLWNSIEHRSCTHINTHIQIPKHTLITRTHATSVHTHTHTLKVTTFATFAIIWQRSTHAAGHIDLRRPLPDYFYKIIQKGCSLQIVYSLMCFCETTLCPGTKTFQSIAFAHNTLKDVFIICTDKVDTSSFDIWVLPDVIV